MSSGFTLTLVDNTIYHNNVDQVPATFRIGGKEFTLGFQGEKRLVSGVFEWVKQEGKDTKHSPVLSANKTAEREVFVNFEQGTHVPPNPFQLTIPVLGHIPLAAQVAPPTHKVTLKNNASAAANVEYDNQPNAWSIAAGATDTRDVVEGSTIKANINGARLVPTPFTVSAPRTEELYYSTKKGPHGSASGTQFDDGERFGAQIRRINVRHGEIVDGIQFVDADGKGTYYGGNNGSADSFNLDADEYITQVKLTYGGWSGGNYITSIQFVSNKKTSDKYGDGRLNQTTVDAGDGNRIYAIFGHHNAYLTQIGFYVSYV